MAVHYKTTKYDTIVEGESLTEQEHADSCDINKMLRAISSGQEVRGGGSGHYGYDDTNMDLLTLRIQKADLEKALLDGQKEFTADELKLFPEEIIKKFGYTLKKEAVQPKAENDDLNDEPAKGTAPKEKVKPKKQTPPPVEDEE